MATPTDPTREETFTRLQVLAVVYAAATTGLPVPREIRFHSDDGLAITFDGAADLRAWEPTFEIDDGRYVHRREQPYPLDPPEHREWCTRTSAFWHGWNVTLAGDDPITDDNVRWWVGSGQAAERAEYLARRAAEGGEQA